MSLVWDRMVGDDQGGRRFNEWSPRPVIWSEGGALAEVPVRRGGPTAAFDFTATEIERSARPKISRKTAAADRKASGTRPTAASMARFLDANGAVQMGRGMSYRVGGPMVAGADYDLWRGPSSTVRFIAGS